MEQAEQDPVEVVKTFGTAWANHDLDAALALTTEDCVFDATGPAPDGTRHVGDATRSARRGSRYSMIRLGNFRGGRGLRSRRSGRPALDLFLGDRTRARHRRLSRSERQGRGKTFVREGMTTARRQR